MAGHDNEKDALYEEPIENTAPVPEELPDDETGRAERSGYGGSRAFAAGLALAGLVATVLVLVYVFSPAASDYSYGSYGSMASVDSTARYQGTDVCGTSPADARMHGCLFDPVLMGWVPAHCHDSQLAAEFLRKHRKNGENEWRFFNHDNTPLTLDDLLSGDFDEVHAEFRFLLLHCAYTHRKVQRAAVLGEIPDGYVADPHQAAHCQMWSLQQNALNDTSTTLYNKYVACPRASRSLGRFGWYRMIGGKKVYRQ